MKKTVLIIGGPTAVGKSGIALALAKEYNCAIISADSRQIFKEISIGTAKPSMLELASVRHHLVDSHSVTEAFNAGMFERSCDKIVTEELKDNDLVIICGGTGLYINAFVNGLDTFPAISQEVMDIIASIFDKEGLTGLQKKLEHLDPAYHAIVDIHNHRRLTRALEICMETGKPYISWLNKRQKKQHPYNIVKVWLNRDREELYRRINQRVETMMSEGWLKEAKSVTQHQHLNSLQTVGYKQLFQYLEGRMSLDNCLEEIKKQTRRYAKRQITWFGNQYGGEELDANTEGLFELLSARCKKCN